MKLQMISAAANAGHDAINSIANGKMQTAVDCCVPLLPLSVVPPERVAHCVLSVLYLPSR